MAPMSAVPYRNSIMRLVFNPLAWEYEEFKTQLEEVALPFHEAAIIELQKIHSEKEEALQQSIREAELEDDESEWQLQHDYARIEKERAKERERVSGWLALVYLVSLLHFKLDKLKSILDETHPPEKKYEGKSWLDKTINEYQRRFRVNLEEFREFGSVRELVLARNAVEHNGGRPTEDYLRLPQPRFLEKIERVEFLNLREQDVIVFPNQHFRETLRMLDEFVDWVVRELIFVRGGKRPVGPLRGAQFIR
jgi:hypothetical protein